MKETVGCMVCGREFKCITPSHLKKHGMTIADYLEKYPGAFLTSETTCKKRSECTAGENNPCFSKFGDDHPAYGNIHTDETKDIISETNRERVWTDEMRENMTGERVERIVKFCLICGDEFKVLPSDADRKYCSTKCANIGNCGDNNPAKRDDVRKKISASLDGHDVSESTREKISEGNEGLLVGDKNPACRPDIAKKISDSLMGHGVSEDVRRKISENIPDQTLENNANWKGGISFEPYCQEFNEKLKQQVRDRYNNCDFMSGLTADICNVINGKVHKLSIHHVDYNKMQGCDGHKWLLIPVSRRHNSIFNGNRPFWERLICYALEYDETYYTDEIKDIFAN